MADEIAEHGARVCLRFSIGPENIGDGPFEVHYEPLEDDPYSGVIMQRIYRADRTYVEREAGTYEYHKTHAHYHHAAFGDLRLFRVTDRRTGAMRLAGEGPKQGFCMGPYKIAEWTRFAQDPVGNVERNCFLFNDPNGVTMGLERGWADVYTWELPGNYVEFGDNHDGYYVIQVKTDAHRDIKEIREDDNVAYAYIEVEGASIRVLERGYGAHPWDPHKRAQTGDTLPPTV
ncbi:MAG TPA: lysyl oxidase family protein, partial [Actinomycetota bacterium]|nr:lysyl oxidase family protein [Actinomycetota bacterium]